MDNWYSVTKRGIRCRGEWELLWCHEESPLKLSVPEHKWISEKFEDRRITQTNFVYCNKNSICNVEDTIFLILKCFDELLVTESYFEKLKQLFFLFFKKNETKSHNQKVGCSFCE